MMKVNYPILALLLFLTQFVTAKDDYTFVIQLENGIQANEVISQLDIEETCFVDVRSLSTVPNIAVVSSSCMIKPQLESLRGLIHIENEIRLELRETTPNDELFTDQWQMELIGATKVWDFSTGGQTVQNDEIVVAVMDEQYSVIHPDLVDNLWVNEAEIPNDGVDNDGNGYIDDYRGFHFGDSTDIHTTGGFWHGTAVAGIIGASGDNEIGVAGVNWDSKIILLDPINPSTKVEEAMLYIYNLRKKYNETDGREGAYVVAFNMSFGATGKFADEDFPIMCALMDSMGTQGILSVGSAPNNRINIDEEGDLPNDCKSDYLISVTNSDEQDELVGNAGYGPTNMDLSAPGDGTISTKRDDSYLSFGGASASAPYVSGSIALLYSAACEDFIEVSKSNPAEASRRMRQAILDGVAPSLDMAGMTTTGGRLDVFESLELLKETSCITTEESESRIAYVTIPQNGAIAEVVLDIGILGEHTIEMFDAAGRLWMEKTIAPTLSPQVTIELDVSLIPSGGYVVRLKGEGVEDVKKFVVVH